MEAFLYTLAAGAVTGLTILAYKHPGGFVVPYIMLMFVVSPIVLGLSGGMLAAAYSNLHLLEDQLDTAAEFYAEANGDPAQINATWEVYYKTAAADAADVRAKMLSAGKIFFGGIAACLYLTFLRFTLPWIKGTRTNSPS